MRNTSIKLVSRLHPVLRQQAEDADVCSKESEQVIAKLQQFMKENESCQGVSASQLGIPKRIAVCRFKNKIYVIQNPEVKWKFGVRRSLERCLNTRGCYFVKRPLLCKIAWYDTDGLQEQQLMRYKKARIFLHEIDHMSGLCIDNIGKYWQYSVAAERYMAKQKEKNHVKNICHTSKV